MRIRRMFGVDGDGYREQESELTPE